MKYESVSDIDELKTIYEACVRTNLPKTLQKPVNSRGRKSFNRFLLMSLVILALRRGWSYRDTERFAREHLKELREIDPALRKAPDHSMLYLTAKKLKTTDIFRVYAKMKEMRGEVPVLWY